LERDHLLVDEVVLKHQPVAASDLLFEAGVPILPIHAPGRIGVQHPGIDVGAIRNLIGIRIQNQQDEGAQSRVGGQRGPFRGQRHQDISVHHAAGLLLAHIEGEEGPMPEGRFHVEAILVIVRGLEPPHLKEGPGAEDAVLMGFVEPPMQGAPNARLRVQPGGGCDAVFRAEIVEVRQELGNQGGRRAQPLEQIFEEIHVHRVDGDVFIALVFSGPGVGSGDLHLRAPRDGRRSRVFLVRRFRDGVLAGRVAASSGGAWPLRRLGGKGDRQADIKGEREHAGRATSAPAARDRRREGEGHRGGSLAPTKARRRPAPGTKKV